MTGALQHKQRHHARCSKGSKVMNFINFYPCASNLQRFEKNTRFLLEFNQLLGNFTIDVNEKLAFPKFCKNLNMYTNCVTENMAKGLKLRI